MKNFTLSILLPYEYIIKYGLDLNTIKNIYDNKNLFINENNIQNHNILFNNISKIIKPTKNLYSYEVFFYKNKNAKFFKLFINISELESLILINNKIPEINKLIKIFKYYFENKYKANIFKKSKKKLYNLNTINKNNKFLKKNIFLINNLFIDFNQNKIYLNKKNCYTILKNKGGLILDMDMYGEFNKNLELININKNKTKIIITTNERVSFWKSKVNDYILINNKHKHLNYINNIHNFNTETKIITIDYLNSNDYLLLSLNKNIFIHKNRNNLYILDIIFNDTKKKYNDKHILEINSDIKWIIINKCLNNSDILKYFSYFNNEISYQNINYFCVYMQTPNLLKQEIKMRIKLLNFTKNEKLKYLDYIEKFNDIYTKYNIKFNEDECLQKLCCFPEKKIKINHIIKEDIYKEFNKKIDIKSINYKNNIIQQLNDNNDIKCLICLNNIEPDNVGITDCGHIFCYNCIYKSLKFNNACPKCRSNINYDKLFYISENKNINIVKQREIVNELGSKLSFLINYIKNKKHVILFSNFEDYINIISELLKQLNLDILVLKTKKDLLKLKLNLSYDIILTTYNFSYSIKKEHINKNYFVLFLEPYYKINSNDKYIILIHRIKNIFSSKKKLIINNLIMKNTIEYNTIYKNINIFN